MRGGVGETWCCAAESFEAVQQSSGGLAIVCGGDGRENAPMIAHAYIDRAFGSEPIRALIAGGSRP